MILKKITPRWRRRMLTNTFIVGIKCVLTSGSIGTHFRTLTLFESNPTSVTRSSMMPFVSLFSAFAIVVLAAAQTPSMRLKTWPDALELKHAFNPIIPAYWTGLPHHRRTPFAISPDGTTGYIAYLDASGDAVHVEHINPRTMKPKHPDVTIPHVKEAGGLVAHNRGFALLGNSPMPSGTANAPPGNTPVPAIYRYKNGKQQWRTFLGGPNVHPADGLAMSPDMNGDLVWSPESELYGAYFVVTNYQGFGEGHFGDSIQYVDDSGTLKTIVGASSSWGCSHNTGIAFEAADEPPFASICSEDQGAIWLNTETQGMSNDGVKISNENVQNGAGNEASEWTSPGICWSYCILTTFQWAVCQDRTPLLPASSTRPSTSSRGCPAAQST